MPKNSFPRFPFVDFLALCLLDRARQLAAKNAGANRLVQDFLFWTGHFKVLISPLNLY